MGFMIILVSWVSARTTFCPLGLPLYEFGGYGWNSSLKKQKEKQYIYVFLCAGDFKVHPKDLIVAPCWLKGFKGNELERLIRKKKMVGDRMMTLDRHNLEKRIRFLYRRFNRTGKHR